MAWLGSSTLLLFLISTHSKPGLSKDEDGIIERWFEREAVRVELGNRVIGGRLADEDEWLWILSLQTPGDCGIMTHFCVASIVAPQWILTAKHCAEATDVLIVGGTLNLQVNTVTKQTNKILKSFPHKDYNPDTQENDIALMKMVEPFNASLHSIELPSKDDDFTRLFCSVLGWGATFENGPASVTLQKTEIPILAHKECVDRFVLAGFANTTIPISVLCASWLMGGRDACQGDSGGPLVCYPPHKNFRPVLAGIVSYGIGCGRKVVPSVYTKVTHYLDWMDEIMKREG